MSDAARLGYAQARIQARHAARPGPMLWHQLEAARDIDHVLETLRASPLARAVAGVNAASSPHGMELNLREFWVERCQATAHWYPERWQPAFEWLRWLPWLPALTWLQQGRPPPAWLLADPAIASLAAAAAGERLALLKDGPLSPLAPAWPDGEPLPDQWDAHWRSLWQPLPVRHRTGLETLSRLHRRIWPGADGAGALACNALLDASQAEALRLFRHHAGSAVAGLAYVTLDWLDNLRLRAAVMVVRVFADARAA
jgi:hypothetical protein